MIIRFTNPFYVPSGTGSYTKKTFSAPVSADPFAPLSSGSSLEKATESSNSSLSLPSSAG